MERLDRITQQPGVMGGKACIRGMRVTVGMVVGQIGAGHSVEEILADCPQPGAPKSPNKSAASKIAACQTIGVAAGGHWLKSASQAGRYRAGTAHDRSRMAVRI